MNFLRIFFSVASIKAALVGYSRIPQDNQIIIVDGGKELENEMLMASFADNNNDSTIERKNSMFLFNINEQPLQLEGIPTITRNTIYIQSGLTFLSANIASTDRGT